MHCTILVDILAQNKSYHLDSMKGPDSSYSHKEICDDIDDLEEEEICEDKFSKKGYKERGGSK